MRPEFRIQRKERIEHHIGVVPRDIGGGAHRVENTQIVPHDEAQRFCADGPRPRAKPKAARLAAFAVRTKFTT
jgi:hypothetical protein